MYEKKSPFWRGLRTENGILHLDAAGNGEVDDIVESAEIVLPDLDGLQRIQRGDAPCR